MPRDSDEIIGEKVLKKQLIEARMVDVQKCLEYNIDEEMVRQKSFRLSEFNHGIGFDDFQNFLKQHGTSVDTGNSDILEYLRDFLIWCTGNGMYGRIRPYALLHVFYMNQDMVDGMDRSPKFPIVGNKIQAYLKELIMPVSITTLIAIWTDFQVLSRLRGEIAVDELASIKEMIKAADGEFRTKEFSAYCWKKEWDDKIKLMKKLEKKYEFCEYFKGIKAKDHATVKFNTLSAL